MLLEKFYLNFIKTSYKKVYGNNNAGIVSPEDFLEIYCKCPLAICETRDVKGIYKRARTGEILNFTGISAPYEEPENPEILLNTGDQSLEESMEVVINFLEKMGIVKGRLSTGNEGKG